MLGNKAWKQIFDAQLVGAPLVVAICSMCRGTLQLNAVCASLRHSARQDGMAALLCV